MPRSKRAACAEAGSAIATTERAAIRAAPAAVRNGRRYETQPTPRPYTQPGRLLLLRALLGDLGLQLRHHPGVAQGGDVAERPALGDVAQEPAHDLARARLR